MRWTLKRDLFLSLYVIEFRFVQKFSSEVNRIIGFCFTKSCIDWYIKNWLNRKLYKQDFVTKQIELIRMRFSRNVMYIMKERVCKGGVIKKSSLIKIIHEIV